MLWPADAVGEVHEVIVRGEDAEHGEYGGDEGKYGGFFELAIDSEAGHGGEDDAEDGASARRHHLHAHVHRMMPVRVQRHIVADEGHQPEQETRVVSGGVSSNAWRESSKPTKTRMALLAQPGMTLYSAANRPVESRMKYDTPLSIE